MEPTVENASSFILSELQDSGSIKDYSLNYYDFGPEWGWLHELTITFNSGRKMKFSLKDQTLEFIK